MGPPFSKGGRVSLASLGLWPNDRSGGLPAALAKPLVGLGKARHLPVIYCACCIPREADKGVPPPLG